MIATEWTIVGICDLGFLAGPFVVFNSNRYPLTHDFM